MCFPLSGFLLTYFVLTNAKKLPNFFLFVLLRWFRLAPSVVALICLYILSQKAGSGPYFHEKLTDAYVEPCKKNWWAHVLFVNNFLTLDQMVSIVFISSEKITSCFRVVWHSSLVRGFWISNTCFALHLHCAVPFQKNCFKDSDIDYNGILDIDLLYLSSNWSVRLAKGWFCSKI